MVVVLGPTGRPVEQFAVDVSKPATVQCRLPSHLPYFRAQASFTAELDVAATSEDVLQAFAAAVVKVQQSTTHMGPPHSDTTFTLMIEAAPVDASVSGALPTLSAEAADGVSTDHSSFWSAVRPEDATAGLVGVRHEPTVAVPLKNLHAGKMRLSVTGVTAVAASA